MADRSVVLRFLSDTTGLKKGFAEAGKGAQEAEGVFAKLEGKLSGVSRGAVAQAAGIAGVATSIVGFATAAIHRLGEEQVAAAQTGAAILSTGGAAQVTAVHIGSLAEELSKLSGVDDEVVQAGENLLLTFTNVKNGVGAGNDVFDQATKAALNMSVALGEDMTAASMQVGKALQDPIAGVTALRRVGVLLNDQQKASIGAFMASGDTMSAQKVILAELNKEFGGSAEAYGKTIPGAIGKAKTAIENWSADVAKKALPAIQSFGGALGDLGKAVGPTLITALSKVGDVILTVGKFAKDHKGYVIAAAVAYTAFLVPAIYRSVAAFALLRLEQIGIVIGLMIGKVVALAISMGTLNLALSAGAIGIAVVGLGYLIERFTSADSKAKAFAASLVKGVDTTTLQGAYHALIDTYVELGKAQDATSRKGNPLIDIATFKGLDRLDAKKLVKELESQAKALEDQIAMVKRVAKEFGISTDEVERYAKANGIDLTGPVADVTAKLEEQYRATLKATKGWTGLGISVEDAVQIQKDITKAFEDAADPIKAYATALTAAQDATKTSSKATADSIRDQAKANRDQVDARHDAEKAALDGEFITGKASKAAHDQRVKNLDAQQKVENDAADATVASEGKRAEAIEKTAVQTGLSMEAYRKSVEKNTRDVGKWITNINLIAARPGGGEVAGMLAQLGPTQAGLVAEVLKSSGPAFDKFVTTMHAAGKTATDETALELAKLPGQVQTIAQTSGQTFTDTLLRQVATGIVPLSALVKKATEDAIAAGIAAAAATTTRGPSGPAGIITTPGGEVVTYKAPVAGPAVPVVRALSGPAARHAEGHFAQVAPAGSWRVWAEPETGGEAYIPLAMSKRAGSMSLLAQVAGAFGHAVVPMATGGTWGVSAYGGDRSAAAAGVSRADLSRLVGALEQSARRRPAQVQNVFNEKVDPLHVARKILWSLD